MDPLKTLNSSPYVPAQYTCPPILEQIYYHPNFRNATDSTENSIFEQEPRLPYLIRQSAEDENCLVVAVNPNRVIKPTRWLVKIHSSEFELSSKNGFRRPVFAKLIADFYQQNLNKIKEKIENYVSDLYVRRALFLGCPPYQKFKSSDLMRLIDTTINNQNRNKYISKYTDYLNYLKLFSRSCQPKIKEEAFECEALNQRCITAIHSLTNAYLYKIEEVLIQKMLNLSRLLQTVIHNESEITTRKQHLKRKIENLENKIHVFKMNGQKFPNDCVGEPFFVQVVACIASGKNALNRLDYLFNPHYYHGLCSKIRATRLLRGKLKGAYLVRKIDHLGKFVLSYVGENKVSHVTIQIHLDSTCRVIDQINPEQGKLAPKPREYPLERERAIPLQHPPRASIEETLRALTKTDQPSPLAHAPLDHLLAQFEWNLAGASKKTMLSRMGNSGCFLEKKALGHYILHVVGTKTNLSSYKIKVKENKIHCRTKGSLKEVSSLYDLITREIGIEYQISYRIAIGTINMMEELYYRKLLPEMQESGKQWAKASRKNHPFLHRSIWYNQTGQIYEQYHKKSFITYHKLKVLSEDEHFKGEGSFKMVWELKPFYPNITWQGMVRVRLGRDLPDSYNLNRLRVANLRKDMGDNCLVLPHFVTYQDTWGNQIYAQVMPTMIGGNLRVALKNQRLSYLGKLRISRDIGRILVEMTAKGWYHRDVKPENIMLSSNDVDNPSAKLSDFDFILPLHSNNPTSYEYCSPLYADPLVLQKSPQIIFFAKQHDQFSFGATLYHIFTQKRLRGYIGTRAELSSWVTVSDLYRTPLYCQIDPTIQHIIHFCCVGEPTDRPYNLPVFVAMLEKLTADEEEKSKQT